jgi:hypothetical protein
LQSFPACEVPDSGQLNKKFERETCTQP